MSYGRGHTRTNRRHRTTHNPWQQAVLIAAALAVSAKEGNGKRIEDYTTNEEVKRYIAMLEK